MSSSVRVVSFVGSTAVTSGVGVFRESTHNGPIERQQSGVTGRKLRTNASLSGSVAAARWSIEGLQRVVGGLLVVVDERLHQPFVVQVVLDRVLERGRSSRGLYHRPGRRGRVGASGPQGATVDIVNPAVEDYMRALQARHDEPVVLEMEAEGKERGFPIVGRLVGVFLHDAGTTENERKALDYLGRAGLDGPVTFHVGDAVSALRETGGEFDVVYCDIDKHGYPEAWEEARERIRVGGLYLCDNVLWSGRVTGHPDVGEDSRPEWTEAIRRHNDAIARDERYLSTIVPTRDGVMVALRLRCPRGIKRSSV